MKNNTSLLSPLLYICTACCILICLNITPAQAEGFALYEWSARGIALGGATMARKPDASAVATNPAAIARLSGNHIMAGVSSVSPRGDMKTTDAAGNQETTAAEANTWFIPHFYVTYQLTDTLTLGYGQFSRFGLGFEYDDDWPGRGNAHSVNLESMSFNPNIAWRATDSLSLAAGVEISYVSLDLNKRSFNHAPNAFGLPSAEFDSDITNADSVGLGFNLAGHYQFTEQWAAGISYRSHIKHRATGKNELTFVNRDAYNAIPPLQNALESAYQDNDSHSTVILPESVAFGVAWTPVPQFSLEAGAIWTRWSRFSALRIHLDAPMHTVSESPKDWNNSWRFNIGAEYDVTDWLALRVGYVYDQSPMTDKYADYLVPTDGRHIYSTGVGLNFDAWTIDLAYAYVKIDGRSYDANNENGHGVLDSHSTNADSHLFSLSLGYEF